MVEVELKEIENSLGIIIPIEMIGKLKLRKGDKIDINIVKKKRIDGFGIAKGAKPLKEDEIIFSDFDNQE